MGQAHFEKYGEETRLNMLMKEDSSSRVGWCEREGSEGYLRASDLEAGLGDCGQPGSQGVVWGGPQVSSLK